MHKNGELSLMIFKQVPRPSKYTPKGILAVDVNEKEMVFGNNVIEERNRHKEGTSLQEAIRKATVGTPPVSITHG